MAETFPAALITDKLYADKRRALELSERRTLGAKVVRVLIQCYGLDEALLL